MQQKSNRIMEESEGPVLCLEVNEAVTIEGYRNMYIPALRNIFEKYGEVRVLYFYSDPQKFLGWEESAAIEDFKNLTEFGHHAKKIVLIDAPEKVSQRWNLTKPLLGGEVREYTKAEFQDALKWIKS